MAIHSSTIAWKIPWIEEPGRLQSMGWVAKSRTQVSDFTFSFTAYMLLSKENRHDKMQSLLPVMFQKHLNVKQ